MASPAAPRGGREGSSRAGAIVIGLSLLIGCSSQAAFLGASTDAQLAMARRDLERGKWSDALVKYQTLAGKLDGSPDYPEVKYGLGKAYCGLGDQPAAERELNFVVREYQESPWADDALFTIAECLWKQVKPPQLDQTMTHKVIDRLLEFRGRFPASDRRDEAAALLLRARSRLAQKAYETGALYLKLGDPPAARMYFEDVLAKYGDTEWAAASRFGIAETYRKEGNNADALQTYRALIEAWPEHRLAERSQERIRRIEAKEGSS